MGVCVCLFVKPYLTSGASVSLEIDVTYSTGNEDKKLVGFSLKLLRCGDPAIPPSYGIRTAAIFPAHALTNEACQLACVREFDVAQLSYATLY